MDTNLLKNLDIDNLLDNIIQDKKCKTIIYNKFCKNINTIVDNKKTLEFIKYIDKHDKHTFVKLFDILNTYNY